MIHDAAENIYFVRSIASGKKKLELLIKEKEKLVRSRGQTLQNLFNTDFSCWVIKNITPNYVFGASCTCKRGMKQHLCKHILGLGIRLGFLETPLAAKDIPIGQKRKRGRPAKAKQALIKQWKSCDKVKYLI